MRTRIAIAVAATALAALAAPSSADDPPYSGGCRLDVTADPTPIGALGGQHAQHGELSIAVVSDTVGDFLEVRCDVYVNGVLMMPGALSATGVGAAAATTRVQLGAEESDRLTVCTTVQIGAQAGDTRCVDVGGVVGGGDGVKVRSAVVGYITITRQDASAPPQYQLHGALADDTLWRCSDNYPATPYAVSCEPNPGVVLVWRCDVLHADVTTTSAASRARISLDCDGWGEAEAQTRVAVGADHDSQWSASSAQVTRFTCTVDDGSWGIAAPSYYGGCGDPGVPTVE